MHDDAAARYQRFWEELTPASVTELRQVAATDMRFADPFNDVTGVERVIEVLRAGFQDTQEMQFVFRDRAAGGDGVWYFRWDCTLRAKRLNGGARFTFPGVSEVTFDATGRALEHLDYWDSGRHFYRRVPVLGWLIERLRRRLAVD